MRIAILSANLGGFDKPVDPVQQKFNSSNYSATFHRYTNEDFPPITGLTPRFQYRIPKFFGWQMFPGYDYYIWLDSSMTLSNSNSAWDLLLKCLGKDMAVFKHPWRDSIKEEAEHIEDHLKKGKPYITKRYKNGLHKEQLQDIQLDQGYLDDHLYASTAFVYEDNEDVRNALRHCWLHQSRYWTCDQLAFTYATKDLDVEVIKDNVFKCEYLEHVSKHE